MVSQPDLFAEPADAAGGELADLLRDATQVFVKKLSNNDRDWARLANKHQAGVYIPSEPRDCGFFPALEAKTRDAGAEVILETFFTTEWPQTGERRETRLVHYTSKGQETHLTRLPKSAFAGLSPASFLVIGRIEAAPTLRWICLTIDSASDEALVLADALALGPDFSVGLFEPELHRQRDRDGVLDFAEQLIAAWQSGALAQFAIEHATMPSTAALAEMAREQWLAQNGLAELDPFVLPRPGDVVRDISRGIEWGLFREFQHREKAVALVRAVLGDAQRPLAPRDLIRALIDNAGEIDRIMLSASQQRKSRAGYSFEHQIEAMLSGGRIPFAKQVIMDARKRPDFVLPSLAWLRAPRAGRPRGLILSAKTTLRERWKQVQREMGGSDLFLATVDESIAANAIEDMAALNIVLVVPESLKASKDTEYVRHANVLGFGDFFRNELAGTRIPGWN